MPEGYPGLSVRTCGGAFRQVGERRYERKGDRVEGVTAMSPPRSVSRNNRSTRSPGVIRSFAGHKWQRGRNTPLCTNSKTLPSEMAEIGLHRAFSAADRNHPQTPRRPRNEGVRGSSPRVGFPQNPHRRWIDRGRGRLCPSEYTKQAERPDPVKTGELLESRGEELPQAAARAPGQCPLISSVSKTESSGSRMHTYSSNHVRKTAHVPRRARRRSVSGLRWPAAPFW
jgi:hypothetical protein